MLSALEEEKCVDAIREGSLNLTTTDIIEIADNCSIVEDSDPSSPEGSPVIPMLPGL